MPRRPAPASIAFPALPVGAASRLHEWPASSRRPFSALLAPPTDSTINGVVGSLFADRSDSVGIIRAHGRRHVDQSLSARPVSDRPPRPSGRPSRRPSGCRGIPHAVREVLPRSFDGPCAWADVYEDPEDVDAPPNPRVAILTSPDLASTRERLYWFRREWWRHQPWHLIHCGTSVDRGDARI